MGCSREGRQEGAVLRGRGQRPGEARTQDVWRGLLGSVQWFHFRTYLHAPETTPRPSGAFSSLLLVLRLLC